MRNYFAVLLIAILVQPSMLWSQNSAPAPAVSAPTQVVSTPTTVAPADSNIEKFCVNDEATYNYYKAILPNYFQNLPVYMGVKTTVFMTNVIAVLNIGFKNDALVLKSDVWKTGSRYKDEQEIKKVCFDRKKKKMTITFNNDQPLNVKYRDSGFDTDGVTLTKLTAAQRQNFANEIIQKENEKNGTPATSTSAPAPAGVEQ